MVVAPEDQHPGIKWRGGSSHPSFTGAWGTGIYAGKMNTYLIIAADGGHAALTCAQYEDEYAFAKFNDWYLPSDVELYLMYANREIIFANWGVPFANEYYWSSTDEYPFVFARNLTTGTRITDSSNSLNRVRCVRSF